MNRELVGVFCRWHMAKCEYKLRNYIEWMRMALYRSWEKDEVHNTSNRKGLLVLFCF